MAAATTPELFSALYDDLSKWEAPVPEYNVLTGQYGAGAGATAAAVCRDGLAQTATRFPITVAFVTDSDLDGIYVAHSLSVYPVDINSPTALDGLLVGLLGDRPASAVPVVFPAAFFAVTAAAAANTLAELKGANGHGAAVPVFRTGPFASGDANTDDLVARPVMVLPPDLSALALRTAPNDGRYTLLGFLNTFIEPSLAGTPAAQARIAPLLEWWRLASTDLAAGATGVSQPLLNTAAPNVQAKLSAWAARVSGGQLSRLGGGGPGLTNAAFNLGVSTIQTTLRENLQSTLEYNRAKSSKTFTDVHGPALATVIHRLCDVTDDADLPDVHKLLLVAGKGRTHGMLNGLFAERSIATDLAITASNAPMATPKLVEDVFRGYQPGGDGITFGKGLSPFAMVCDGHEGMLSIKKNTMRLSMMESGGTITMADADLLVSDDVRFPSEAYPAVEKLNAWSVVIDVFHGVEHEIAISVRNAVRLIGPLLQRMYSLMADNPGAGMEAVCRVMFDMQQDYFKYLTQKANGVANVVCPAFTDIVDAVQTHRVSGLSKLPGPWYEMKGCPQDRGRLPVSPASTTGSGSAARGGSSALTLNPHPDDRLVRRFKDSGFSSITSMINGRDLPFPKHNNKSVCMAWALKGNCNANCKRADQHVRYGSGTLKALHKLMDDCEVAGSAQA